MTVKQIKLIMTAAALLIGVPFFVFTTTFGWQLRVPNNQPLGQEGTKTVGRLKNVVQHLAVDIGIRNYHRPLAYAQAADYIAEEFTKLGYSVHRQEYKFAHKNFVNIIATHSHPSTNVPKMIIGAHYDTHHNPGADDNASGVAVLIELAAILKNYEFNGPVEFVAFANEEPPFFLTEGMGSYVYARTLHEEGQKIAGAIILESLGYFQTSPFSQRYLALMGPFYPSSANFVAVVGNFDSRHLVHQIYSGIRKSKRLPVEKLVAPERVPGVYFSDHWSFWQFDFPAIMVTDTAFLRNPNYHQPSDLPHTLNYEEMAQVSWALKDAITRLDEVLYQKHEGKKDD